MSAHTLDALVFAYFAVGLVLAGVWLTSLNKETLDEITPLSLLALVATWPVFALVAAGIAIGTALKSRGI